MHATAWKVNSADFAITEFSEVELPLYGVLGSSAALKFFGEGGPGGAPVDR
jgi:hypothetical protein